MQQRRLLLVGNFFPAHHHYFSQSDALATMLRQHGYAVTQTSKYRAPFRRITDMLHTIISQRHRYDLAMIDVYSGRALVWADAAVQCLRWLGQPYSVILHGGHLPDVRGLAQRRLAAMLQHAQAVITPSVHRMRAAVLPMRCDPIHIPNSITVAHYPYRIRTSVRPAMLWLRAFHRIYQPCLAIDVLARVRQDHADATLTMIGPDKGDGSLQHVLTRATALGVQHALRIVPGIPKSEVPVWMRDVAIFLNTTTVDTFPVSVIEAAASGLCIVTTNAGDLPYLWRDGENAYVTAVGDAPAMADRVLHLLAHPNDAARLSARARQTAMQYDWQHVWPQWHALFDRLFTDIRLGQAAVH